MEPEPDPGAAATTAAVAGDGAGAGAEAGAGAGAETGAETGEVLRDLLQVQRVQTGVAGDKEHGEYIRSHSGTGSTRRCNKPAQAGPS